MKALEENMKYFKFQYWNKEGLSTYRLPTDT